MFIMRLYFQQLANWYFLMMHLWWESSHQVNGNRFTDLLPYPPRPTISVVYCADCGSWARSEGFSPFGWCDQKDSYKMSSDYCVKDLKGE